MVQLLLSAPAKKARTKVPAFFVAVCICARGTTPQENPSALRAPPAIGEARVRAQGRQGVLVHAHSGEARGVGAHSGEARNEAWRQMKHLPPRPLRWKKI